MYKTSLISAAAIVLCIATPSGAAKGGNGKGNGNGSGPVACGLNDLSLAALACSGFYSGNLLNNADVSLQTTGLNAIDYRWDGNFTALSAAGQKFDTNGATEIDFAQMLYGITVIGIHFGGGGPHGVGNGTAFYKFDAGKTGVNVLALNYPGSSGVVLYSTGHAPPPPNNIELGVPEPSSWLMMIGGFGLVGYTLRRRRPALSFG